MLARLPANAMREAKWIELNCHRPGLEFSFQTRWVLLMTTKVFWITITWPVVDQEAVKGRSRTQPEMVISLEASFRSGDRQPQINSMHHTLANFWLPSLVRLRYSCSCFPPGDSLRKGYDDDYLLGWC